MPYDNLQSAVSRADFKAAGLERSIHITSDGTKYYVERVDADWNHHPVVKTAHPSEEHEEDWDDGDVDDPGED